MLRSSLHIMRVFPFAIADYATLRNCILYLCKLSLSTCRTPNLARLIHRACCSLRFWKTKQSNSKYTKINLKYCHFHEVSARTVKELQSQMAKCAVVVPHLTYASTRKAKPNVKSNNWIFYYYSSAARIQIWFDSHVNTSYWLIETTQQ